MALQVDGKLSGQRVSLCRDSYGAWEARCVLARGAGSPQVLVGAPSSAGLGSSGGRD